MALESYGTIEVCTDCYFAHHYGRHEIKPEDADQWNKAGWYAGEGDEPCDREPLGEIGEDFHVFDATCSNHEVTDCAMGVCDYHACPHCGHNDPDDGITEFSSWSCHGCESHLGGSRYRLSLWKEKTDA